jgi:hypothetical protein
MEGISTIEEKVDYVLCELVGFEVERVYRDDHPAKDYKGCTLRQWNPASGNSITNSNNSNTMSPMSPLYNH